VQAKSQLNCQLVSYNKKFRTASKNQQKLEDEARSLKNQGFALKAKS
jgi:cell division protein FtsB